MGIYSSGKKWKAKAQGAMAMATDLKNQQNDIDFRRGLLANIRENRIARSVIQAGNQSDDFTSSSVQGAISNVDSALAGELGYSYDTSLRAQQIQDYSDQASMYMKKFAKQQKTRKTSIAVTGMVLGAVAGAGLAAAGVAGGLSVGEAALTGATVGQGFGQMAGGDVEQGLNTAISGGAMGYKFGKSNALVSQYDSIAERLTKVAGKEAGQIFKLYGGY